MNTITARPRRLDEPLPMSENPGIPVPATPTQRSQVHKHEHCLSISSDRSLTFPIPAGTVITEFTIMRGNLSIIPTGLNLSIILRENASAASPAVETLHADVALFILNDGSVINYRHSFSRSYSHDHVLHLVLSQEVVGYEIVVLAKTREYSIKPSAGIRAAESSTSFVNEEVPSVLNHRHTIECFRSDFGTVHGLVPPCPGIETARIQPLKSGTPRRLQNTTPSREASIFTVTPKGCVVCGKTMVDCQCQFITDTACPECGTQQFHSHGVCINGHAYPTR